MAAADAAFPILAVRLNHSHKIEYDLNHIGGLPGKMTAPKRSLTPMPKSFFLVRAVVAPHLRDKFDHWTSADHLPRALADFKVR